MLPVRKRTTHAKSESASRLHCLVKKHIVLLCKTFLYTCQLYIFRRLLHFALVFDFAATITFCVSITFCFEAVITFCGDSYYVFSITFCGVTHTYCSKRTKARTILSLWDLSYYFKEFYNFFF